MKIKTLHKFAWSRIIDHRIPHSALLILLAGTVLSSGCSSLMGGQVPTFIPEDQLPTVIELTAQALVAGGLVTPPPPPTLSPADLTATAFPTPTATPELEPSLSPTSTIDVVLGTPEPLKLPDPLPQAKIQIINPGRLSRVRSPFKLHLFLAPTQSERNQDLEYQLALFGDDGRTLLQESFSSRDNGEQKSHLVVELSFRIPSSAESARLEISSRDESGRLVAVASTDLILLTEGEEEIKAIVDLYDRLIIQQPIPSTLIQGDILFIQGISRYVQEDQLVVELINRDGGQVGSGLVSISPEDLGHGYRHFEGEIPFQVGSSSWIRVQVIARDGKFSGIQHLSSVEVLVSP